MEGSTIEKEDNFDELDNVFTENSDVKTETTSERTDRVNEENSLESGPSELGTTNDKSPDSNASAENSQIESGSQESDSKFFAIRTTGGQEHIVVNLAQNRINSKKIPVRSILLLDSFKGYIIVEAPDSNIAYDALIGVRHVKGQIRGELPYKDIESYLVKRPVVTELNIDDTVEVIAGPFKSMKAKITRVDYEKQEATVLLLDSPYQIPVTVDANYLKKAS
ncbi:MAG: transcription elongation factor Spt5 [Nitrososphaeraceae archaeon]|nr:transcription elongation factor Spt5 [Nitrososphaeraceae archaeon]MDW0137341.1 transcription elongation factor Spt5 [Nitrososphaeraceae archaeon]MDW0138285.1 transcription elongation factor Spt5 [Nitrososphaeraceae archaeon]MDW0141506.1 transcription elongation factor Spt5 [Nitrososphaeraceae archaeon]MDW0143458.1 transcription elongation factor Spt5 [Nitrososphaeraceae archaeon]